jgi:hypothetical protein
MAVPAAGIAGDAETFVPPSASRPRQSAALAGDAGVLAAHIEKHGLPYSFALHADLEIVTPIWPGGSPFLRPCLPAARSFPTALE